MDSHQWAALAIGGAGFMGRPACYQSHDQKVVCINKLTSLANRSRLTTHIAAGPRRPSSRPSRAEAVEDIVATARPDVIFHLAAESNIDRSIDGPSPCIEANAVGTLNLGPPSHLGVTGLYFYPVGVTDVLRQIGQSPRGELDIAAVNNWYLDRDPLRMTESHRGFAWLDTGTYEGLHQAASFVQTVQERRCLLVAGPTRSPGLGYIGAQGAPGDRQGPRCHGLHLAPREPGRTSKQREQRAI